MKMKQLKPKIKSFMQARQVKTNQQIWREVELKGVCFSRVGKWQSEYSKVRNES